MFGLFEKPAVLAVRRIGVDEGEDCAALHAASFTYSWPPSEVEALLLASSTLAHGAFGPKGDLQGFILSRVAADEAEVLTIAVAARRRGRGVGGRLVTATLAALARAGVKSLFLEVEADNGPARALYKRFSFAIVGERKAYYRKEDGTTALAFIMRRPID